MKVTLRSPLRRWKESPFMVAVLALSVFIMSLMALTESSALACQVEAAPPSSHTPANLHVTGDFCYRTPITVAKSSAGNLTAYPVGVDMNIRSFVTGQRLGTFAWDALPVNPGFVELQGVLQDVRSGASASTFWIHTDLVGSGSVALNLYTGSSDMARNQGIRFHQGSGRDVVKVTDHADFDITDDLDIIIEVEADSASQTAYIVDKLTGNNGYRAHVTTTSGGSLAFTVGSGAATDTLEVAWDGSNETVRFRFDAGAASDMDIAFRDTDNNWVSQGSQDAAYASLGTNAIDIGFGDAAAAATAGFDGTIRNVEIHDVSGKVAQWTFNPYDLTETAHPTASPWTFTGTVDDLMVGHDGTYSLTRDQDNLTVTLGATAFNFSDPTATSSETTAEFVGLLGTTNFATTSASPVWESWGTLGSALSTAIGSTDLTTTSFKYLIVLALATFSGGLIYLKSRDMDEKLAELLFAFTFIVLFGTAAGVEFLPAWWSVITGFVVLAGWLVVARARA